jgi:nucleoside-diphosphate-sugar epimerase/phosphohistidine swiveling domain-containing protein
MRVVVSGASGEFAASIVPELLSRGYEVVGLSRRAHSFPSAAYRHVCVDVRDAEALVEATRGADAIIHLAWTTHPTHDLEATRAVDIGGTSAVLEAMQRNGIQRLVMASSVMAYGARADNPPTLTETDPLRPSVKHIYSQHKAEAEDLVAASGLNALLVRASVVMGRSTTGVTQEGWATPVILGVRGAANVMQCIHPDDLARFFADAVARPDWTGPVNLAGDGSLTIPEIARVLGKRYVELPQRATTAMLTFLWDRHLISLDPGAFEAVAYFPIVDTTRLTTEFGWHPAWTSRECVEDFKRANRDHVFVGTRKVGLPWRWPWAPVPPVSERMPERTPAAQPGLAGEFDSTVNPRWPVYTAANTSEAFPGPMTPLSLELSMSAMRAAGIQAARILDVDDDLRQALAEDNVGAFGHGVYANLSVVFAMGNMLPGADLEVWQSSLMGSDESHGQAAGEKMGALAIARRMPGLLAKLLRFGSHATELDDRAREAQRDWASIPTFTDEQLIAQLSRCADEVTNAWAAASQATAYVVPLMGLIEKQRGKGFATRIRIGDELVSAKIAGGARRLANTASRDEELSATLRQLPAAEALSWIKSQRRDFARELEQLIDEAGHRGPRETELANRVFADSPERIVDTIAKLLDAPSRATDSDEQPMSRRLKVLASVASRFQRTREQVRDAAIRHTHEYRLLAREIGNRLTAQGIIDSADDVFYLTRQELSCPPPDARAIVLRRHAERERLTKQRPPINFVKRWDIEVRNDDELQPGQHLQGTPVSAGLAKGRVRVLTIDSMDDLEPGEVMVTSFTDTGWTPFFTYAAAVVVDTGGEMSHAAVVAREFGIPCVVGTSTASRVLRTGHVVEVDGSTGTVIRVE